MKTFHKSAAQSGRSMVEMLGVLAIVGVLSVGGIAGYSMAMSKFKITKTIDQVQTIITNMRTLYASQRKYTALSASAAYNMGILTDETYDSTKGQGVNPYGGDIHFYVTSGGREWQLAYTRLTAEACLKLATADWGADASSGLVRMNISGDDASSVEYTWTGANKLPPELSSAARSCAGSSPGANMAFILWTFR